MMLGLFSMSGCSKSDPTGPYPLTAEEAKRAKASAENYFRQQIWPVKGEEGRDEMKSGLLSTAGRPTATQMAWSVVRAKPRSTKVAGWTQPCTAARMARSTAALTKMGPKSTADH